MIRYLSVAALVAVGATFAYAQGAGGAAAIAERKAAMKAVGGAAKAVGDMIKGDQPFDKAKVATAYKTMEDNFLKVKGLFPDDSKSGGETTVLPAIWEKKADFLAKLDKASGDAKAAAVAATDLEALKGAQKGVGANCGGCHKEYRQPPK